MLSIVASSLLLIIFPFNFADADVMNAQLVTRKVPLCLRHDDEILARSLLPDSLNKEYRQFIPIIENANNFLSDNVLKLRSLSDSSIPNQTEHKILHWILFSKIKLDLPRARNTERVSPNHPLGDGNDFNQWFHIQIKTQRIIAGLIVQAFQGPLGIPFGNFPDFRGDRSERCVCTECISTARNFIDFPCTYKPRASLTHPSIYTWHADFARTNPETKRKDDPDGRIEEIHLNFNFCDLICQRASTIKFLVLAIEDFGDSDGNGTIAEAAFTETFYRPSPASSDGIPYPFHPDFCQALVCGESDRDSGTYIKDDHQVRLLRGLRNVLRINVEYDKCVELKSFHPTEKTCPPGFFKCDSDDQIVSDLLTESNLYRKLSNYPSCSCDEIDLGETSSGPKGIVRPTEIYWNDTSLFEEKREEDSSTPALCIESATAINFQNLPEELRVDIETLHSIAEANGWTRILHGIVMFFAFSISSSMSVFLSRFAKDVSPGGGCCVKELWLWGHILFAFLSLTTMWVALVILLITDNSLWPWKIIHIFFGFIAMLLFHVNFVFGWVRPIGQTSRGLYITIHAVFGYVSKVSAAFAMVMTQIVLNGVEFFPLFAVLAAEAVTLLFYGLSTLVQWLTDRCMKLKYKRRICPYVEHNELEHPIPIICRIVRNILLILYFLSLAALFVKGVIHWPDPIIRSYYDLISTGNWNRSDELNIS